MAVFVCQNSSQNQSAKTCAVLGFETIPANLHRRHLTSSQLAVVALDVEKIFAAEAEKRMKAGVKVEDNPPSIMTEGSKGESAVKAAAALKTNDNYVKAASFLRSRLLYAWCDYRRLSGGFSWFFCR